MQGVWERQLDDGFVTCCNEGHVPRRAASHPIAPRRVASVRSSSSSSRSVSQSFYIAPLRGLMPRQMCRYNTNNK